MDDGDFPLAAVSLALGEGQHAAVVRPRGEREVSLQQAFGIAAIGVRDPQVALLIRIGDPVDLGERPGPDLAVVRRRIAATMDHQVADPKLMRDL